MGTPAPRAAIYLRVSLDRENNRLAVDRHREAAEEAVHKNGYDLVGIYEDNDVTGTGRAKREDFERLLSDMDAGKIDVVMAQEWPRLERNRVEGVRVIEAAMRSNVLLAFVKGPPIDCTSAEGRFLADMFSGLARREIEVKAERQSAAQRQRAKQGRPPKGVRPLGYAISGEQIPHEAEAVRAIFNAFHSGAAILAIARALSGDKMITSDEESAIPSVPKIQRHDRTLAIERNARRVEENKKLPKEQHRRIRPVPEDKPWTPSTVLGILRNPRYAGYSTYQKKDERPRGFATTAEERTSKRRAMRDAIVRDKDGQPVPPSGWEAIVKEDLWWSVQAMLDDKKRATNRVGTQRRHTGSGIYLCGLCYHQGVRRPMRSHSRGYRCTECQISRSRGLVDAYVIKEVRDRLGGPDLEQLLAGGAEDPRVEEISRSIEKLSADVQRAGDDYAARKIDGDLYRRIADQSNAQIEELEKQRLALATGTTALPVMASKSPVEAFDEADLATRRAVISELCDVILYPQLRGQKGLAEGSIELVWK